MKEKMPATDAITVRSCRGLDELRLCVALQKEVWNFSDADLVPLRMFVVAEKVGGQVVGAFHGSNLAGFALAVPGVRDRKFYLHSHMLAVREEFRNAGVGRRLKLFQRDEAIGRGFDLMEWTFDPLEIKNSYFNIERLGAIARRYVVNQYGITSSPLQGGLPTDRLVAEWWLNSPRVQAAVRGNGKAPLPSPSQSQKAIAVPAEIYEWKASPAMRARAQEVQDRNRAQFLAAFAEGLTVLGYERDQHGNGKFLLGRQTENEVSKRGEVKRRVEEALAPLVGIVLWGAHRAADLEVLKFGKRRSVTNRRGESCEVGEYALHLQCAWRIAGAQGIVVASRDVYEPSGSPDKTQADFNWENGNRRDKRTEDFFSHQERDSLLIERVSADEVGGFRLDLSQGFRLEVFPDDTLPDEHWRLLRPSTDFPHFVMTGLGIEN